MNKIIILTVIALLGSPMAFAKRQPTAPPVPAGADRREEGPGVWGVLHTENYEYACPVVVIDGKDKINSTIWLDVDFIKNPANRDEKYRLAAAFPGNSRIGDLLGVEMPITEVAYGRCLGLCLSFNVERDGSDPLQLTFVESVGKISLQGYNLATRQLEISGTCAKNEVP